LILSEWRLVRLALGANAERASRGIVVRGESNRTVREEISEAYKDVANVVDAVEGAGISQKVAQLRPLGVIKG
jgi:tRNA-splicing ligase RtcB